jgi:hypothetical protein
MPIIFPKLKKFAETPGIGEEMYRDSKVGVVKKGEGMFMRGVMKEIGMEKSK